MKYVKNYLALAILLGSNIGFLMGYRAVPVTDRIAIREPGYYVVMTNIEADYPLSDEMAITLTYDATRIIDIDADDVILDLNLHTVSQKDTNTQTDLSAVVIRENHKNISIRNGRISDVTHKGVVVSDGCTDVHLDGVHVMNATAGGIHFDGTTQGISHSSINNSHAFGCSGSSDHTAYGLYMKKCSNIALHNNVFEYSDAQSDNNGYGMYVETATLCSFEKCSALHNGGDTLGAGLYIKDGYDCTVNSLHTVSNVIQSSNSSAYTYGLLLEECNNTIVSNSQSRCNMSSQANSVGFAARDGSNNVFSACSSEANGGDVVAAGFLLDGENYSCITDCLSRLNNGNSGDGYGILLDNNAQYCEVHHNRCTNNQGDSGTGVKDTTLNSSNLITSNVCFKNTTTGFDVTRNDGDALPVVYGSVGNISQTNDVSSYYNVAVE